MQGRERVRTLSVQRPQLHTTNPWKEEDKMVGDKKERADHANRKAFAYIAYILGTNNTKPGFGLSLLRINRPLSKAISV